MRKAAVQEAFTTHEVGRICHVDYTTVSRWVDQGKLEAFQTPGGHRRIPRKTLIEFLKKNSIPLPPDLVRESRVRILVVDDEESALRMLERFLQKSGWNYDLDIARNGFEAGQKVVSFDPDVVILDIFLPGLDGFQVCERIRDLKRSLPIRVLAISGQMTPENRERILRAGAADTLAKPFTQKEFVDKLSSICPALRQRPLIAS
jgi:excisionase family DNA binding protein